jgi:putative hydrolase of the HAD superfamily
MIKAVIFDMWSTTLHSRPDFGTRVLEELGLGITKEELFLQLEEHWMKHRFESVHDSVAHAFRKIGINDPAKARKFAKMFEEDQKHMKPYDDAIPVISELRKKYKTGLLSNTECFVEMRLKETGFLENFDAIVFSFDHGLLKPDPRIFRLILAKLGVAPGEAVMVGDKITADIEPAERIGMHAVLIDRNGRHPNIKNRIQSLYELEGAIADVQ